MIEPGETFLKLDRWNHLWFALSGPTATGMIALVNLTTHKPERPDHESCLLLGIDDHPYIVHESCIFFRGARLISQDELEQRKTSGASPQHAKATPELLRRLQDGALADPRVDSAVKQAIRDAPAQPH